MVDFILCLDSGNTRIKYSDQSSYGTFDSITELSAYLAEFPPSVVVVADVGGRYSEISRICSQHDIQCIQCCVVDGFYGLKLAYADVTKLGVDRWLAMLGAMSLFPKQPLQVIDVGTAVKIDHINAQGLHLGGSISPGLRLSARALSQGTELLPEVDLQFSGELGKSTTDCITYGLVMSVVALIERAMLQFETPVTRVITGGDSGIICQFLAGEVTIEHHLIMLGLRVYCESDEFKTKVNT
jgi:type III pantothenate kinase